MNNRIYSYSVLNDENYYYAILSNPDDDGYIFRRFDSYVELKLYYDLRGF